MNYRYINEFTPPFRIVPTLTKIHDHQMELVVKLHADFKRTLSAANVRVIIPVPQTTDTVSLKMEKRPEPEPGQSTCVTFCVVSLSLLSMHKAASRSLYRPRTSNVTRHIFSASVLTSP